MAPVRNPFAPSAGSLPPELAGREEIISAADTATGDACFAAMGDPATMAMIIADEEKLFDRSRIRTFTVEERGSELGGGS